VKARGLRICEKCRLRPEQLRTVAARRFDDADALRRTGSNARANGAIYLGGFVVECLLKAKLLDEFPWLQNAGPERKPAGNAHRQRSKEDNRLHSLCYRPHDLDEILAKLPGIKAKLSELEQQESNRLTQSLMSICAEWTIYARYCPHSAHIDDAREFLDKIEELRIWLT
jgi:hypothetical protein